MGIGKSKIFLWACLSFVAGVFFGRYINFTIISVMLMIFVMLVTVFWKKPKAVLIGALGLFFLLGSWRYGLTDDIFKRPDYVGQFYEQELKFDGTIWEDPDVRSDQIKLTVRPDGYSGNILLNVGKYPEYQYGDRLKISGKLREPFESEEFSYKNYLLRYGVYGIIYYPKIEKIGQGQGNPIKNILFTVKRKFQDILSKLLPEPHNAFLLGLLLGLKRGIPDTLKNAFILTGVSHIVVISGYNISIITRNILQTRQLWGRRIALVLSLLTVLAFVILTGAEASVIRAATMGILLVVALNLERIYQVWKALVFTAAVMILFNPQILVFDVGFQLSFAATTGLIFLSPIFDKWFKHIPNFLEFRTNLASTLAAQIFTLPLLVFYFDRISVIAPLVNVLVLWAIPYTMFLGFFTGLLGMIFFPFGQALSAFPWILLEYMIRTVEWFANFSLASFNIQINILVLVLYYAVLVSMVMFYRNKKKFYYQLEYLREKL